MFIAGTLFVHAVYGGDDFYTHVLLPESLILWLACLRTEDLLCDPGRRLRSANSFCVHLGPIEVCPTHISVP